MAKRKDFDDTALKMLFGEQEENDGGLTELSLDDILPFHTGGGHPFEVVEDTDMMSLEDDMRENGQLEPIIVRKDVNLQGRYETIAGHRRAYVARKIGLEKVKVLIVDYDDEQAVKLMVVSNLQKRTEIKPSVKAKAYAMYMEANKRQAGRPKNNSCQVGTNLRTDDQAAEEFKESARTIQRYIRLNQLILPLLDMVDAKEMKVGIGVEVSYLDTKDQEALLGYIRDGFMPTLDEAAAIKQHCTKDGGHIDDMMNRLLGKGPAEEDVPKVKKIKLPKLNERFINEYLPEPMRRMNVEKKRAYTQAALIMYNNYLLEHPEEQAEWETEE